jgi:uncharacterized protein DUF4399
MLAATNKPTPASYERNNHMTASLLIQKSTVFACKALVLTLLLAACGGTPAASATPTLKITSPADGATVKGPKVEFEVAVTDWKLVPASGTPADGEGHLHFFIDTPAASVVAGQPIPPTTANPAYIHAGKDPLTSRELQLSPGKHTITVVMGNAAHVALSSPAPQTITITVE